MLEPLKSVEVADSITSVDARPRLQCRHTNLSTPSGLVLLAFGLPGDDKNGLARALCDALPAATLAEVCRFDLNAYDDALTQSLGGHHAAVIVDATGHGMAPGTISITDVSAFLEHRVPPNFDSEEGIHLADELRSACLHEKLPARVILFAVGVNDTVLQGPAAPTAHSRVMHPVVQRLSHLISTVLNSLKREGSFSSIRK